MHPYRGVFLDIGILTGSLTPPGTARQSPPGGSARLGSPTTRSNRTWSSARRSRRPTARSGGRRAGPSAGSRGAPRDPTGLRRPRLPGASLALRRRVDREDARRGGALRFRPGSDREARPRERIREREGALEAAVGHRSLAARDDHGVRPLVSIEHGLVPGLPGLPWQSRWRRGRGQRSPRLPRGAALEGLAEPASSLPPSMVTRSLAEGLPVALAPVEC